MKLTKTPSTKNTWNHESKSVQNMIVFKVQGNLGKLAERAVGGYIEQAMSPTAVAGFRSSISRLRGKDKEGKDVSSFVTVTNIDAIFQRNTLLFDVGIRIPVMDKGNDYINAEDGGSFAGVTPSDTHGNFTSAELYRVNDAVYSKVSTRFGGINPAELISDLVELPGQGFLASVNSKIFESAVDSKLASRENPFVVNPGIQIDPDTGKAIPVPGLNKVLLSHVYVTHFHEILAAVVHDPANPIDLSKLSVRFYNLQNRSFTSLEGTKYAEKPSQVQDT